MKFRICKILRFWVDCSYEDRRYEKANRTRTELIADILCEYEQCGDAMRYLNATAQIAWNATPFMLRKLTDAQREVEDDMADLF
jgi:predicted transcriptional regulator